MRELDQPVGEQAPVEMECGEPMSPMHAPEAPHVPPSLSINMNAQGMDDIADILKLVAKVSPDAMPKDGSLPSMSAPPTIMSIKPMEPDMKMLPDLSDEPHGEPDGDEKPMSVDKDREEGYANEPNVTDQGTGPAYPFDADGNDLNKPKGTYPKVAGGDNPRQPMESGDLRAQIRAELLQRLAEAKQS